MSRKINAITKRAGCPPRSVSVANTLENFQKHVGGYIETVTYKIYGKTFVIICNEEGIWLDLPDNCIIDGIKFRGDIVIVGADLNTGEFTDLPCSFQEAKKWMPGLWEVEA